MVSFMYKVAVLGDGESIAGFACLGITPFAVTDKKEAAGLIKRLCDEQYGAIYITEQLVEKIYETIEKYREKPVPSIIPIPGVRNNTGRGMREIHRAVEKAVGSDILSK